MVRVVEHLFEGAGPRPLLEVEWHGSRHASFRPWRRGDALGGPTPAEEEASEPACDTNNLPSAISSVGACRLTANAPRPPAAINKLSRPDPAEVDEGLLPAAQFALALDGEIVEERVFGEAGPGTRYCMFSATKPFVASTVWRLIADGARPAQPVTTWFPAFGANGKDAITLEQVMLHTSGFPTAPMGPAHWSDRADPQERMAAWRLNWEPGTRYEYHPTAAHWVLAELIETVTGTDFRDAIDDLVTGPLGLPRIVGLPLDDQDDIAIAEPRRRARRRREELMAAFGVPGAAGDEVTDEAISRFNEPEARAVGVPGGGGFARAVDVARFYQALLHGDEDVWPADLLQDVTTNVRNRMPDPPDARQPHARSDGGRRRRVRPRAGFGRTVSPATFGHNGAGGQIAWADPATGLSFAFVTNGYDRHEVRQPRRTTSLGSLAAVTAPRAEPPRRRRRTRPSGRRRRSPGRARSSGQRGVALAGQAVEDPERQRGAPSSVVRSCSVAQKPT